MMLATLAKTVERTGWQVHAWVWMSNHYHLLVETPEANLVKGMTCGNGVQNLTIANSNHPERLVTLT